MTAKTILVLGMVLLGSGPVEAKHYSISIPPERQAKYKEANYFLWIPEGAGKLRAVILHQHGCGEPAESAGATATFDLQWQALAKKWDCALMGACYRQSTVCSDWASPENGSEAAFLKALEQRMQAEGIIPNESCLPVVEWLVFLRSAVKCRFAFIRTFCLRPRGRWRRASSWLACY